MLTRIVRRRFCSGTPFHHDFHPGNFDKSSTDLALAMFDFGRIFLYLYLGLKFVTHTPALVVFRKTNFMNNPDYAICDEATYMKMKN